MLTGDLDSSLANLASNLDFGNGAKKNHIQGGARGPPMTQVQGFAAFPGQQAQPAMDSFSPGLEAFPSSSVIPPSSSHPSFPSSTLSPFPGSTTASSPFAASSGPADPFNTFAGSPFSSANDSPFPHSGNFSTSFTGMNGNSDFGMGSNNNSNQKSNNPDPFTLF